MKFFSGIPQMKLDRNSRKSQSMRNLVDPLAASDKLEHVTFTHRKARSLVMPPYQFADGTSVKQVSQ